MGGALKCASTPRASPLACTTRKCSPTTQLPGTHPHAPALAPKEGQAAAIYVCKQQHMHLHASRCWQEVACVHAFCCCLLRTRALGLEAGQPWQPCMHQLLTRGPSGHRRGRGPLFRVPVTVVKPEQLPEPGAPDAAAEQAAGSAGAVVEAGPSAFGTQGVVTGARGGPARPVHPAAWRQQHAWCKPCMGIRQRACHVSSRLFGLGAVAASSHWWRAAAARLT